LGLPRARLEPQRDLVGQESTVDGQHEAVAAPFDESGEVGIGLVERAERHAVARTQYQLECLLGAHVGVELLGAALRALARVYRRQVTLRGAVVPPPAAGSVRVS